MTISYAELSLYTSKLTSERTTHDVCKKYASQINACSAQPHANVIIKKYPTTAKSSQNPYTFHRRSFALGISCAVKQCDRIGEKQETMNPKSQDQEDAIEQGKEGLLLKPFSPTCMRLSELV